MSPKDSYCCDKIWWKTDFQAFWEYQNVLLTYLKFETSWVMKKMVNQNVVVHTGELNIHYRQQQALALNASLNFLIFCDWIIMGWKVRIK